MLALKSNVNVSVDRNCVKKSAEAKLDKAKGGWSRKGGNFRSMISVSLTYTILGLYCFTGVEQRSWFRNWKAADA